MLPSLDFVLEAVGYDLIVPAVVAVVGLMLALRLGRGEPLAIVAGLAAGYAALTAAGQIKSEFLKPEESWDWLPALGLLAGVVAFAAQWAPRSLILRWAGRLVVAALTAGLLIRAQAVRQPIESYWYAVLAIAVLALWCLLDLAARRQPGGLFPALLALVALAAAMLTELAGLSSHQAGVVAGALLGWSVVAWRRPQPEVCRAGIPVLAVQLPGTLFVASFNSFSDVPPASYELVLAAPLVLGVVCLLTRGRSWVFRAVTEGLATLVPLAGAFTLAEFFPVAN